MAKVKCGSHMTHISSHITKRTLLVDLSGPFVYTVVNVKCDTLNKNILKKERTINKLSAQARTLNNFLYYDKLA